MVKCTICGELAEQVLTLYKINYCAECVTILNKQKVKHTMVDDEYDNEDIKYDDEESLKANDFGTIDEEEEEDE